MTAPQPVLSFLYVCYCKHSMYTRMLIKHYCYWYCYYHIINISIIIIIVMLMLIFSNIHRSLYSFALANKIYFFILNFLKHFGSLSQLIKHRLDKNTLLLSSHYLLIAYHYLLMIWQLVACAQSSVDSQINFHCTKINIPIDKFLWEEQKIKELLELISHWAPLALRDLKHV